MATLLISLVMPSKNSSKNGTGSMVPMTASKKAQYQSMLNAYIATGRAPRSSIIGSADIMMTIISLAIPQLISSSTTLAPVSTV